MNHYFGREYMDIAPDVQIGEDCWIDCLPQAKLTIKAGTNIARRCTIGCNKSITIEEKVLFGPNVFVSDANHEYGDTTIPIMDQGMTPAREITIGSGSWIGANAVIMASVGKNCVVGANAVVTHDIPDYTVCGGIPARIIKYIK